MKTVWPALLCFAVFLGVFFHLLNVSYPLIGQDVFYFFPRLLAGKWHFAHAGLLPFRYIPQLCGGFPLYGNPQDVYYSLLQFLSMIMDLWTAAQVSMAVMLIAGYAGWYRFGRDVLRLPALWAHVLCIVALANGYYLLHMLIGHFTFHTTPLLGWFLWFFYQPGMDARKTHLLKACGVGLLGALVLYAGGYFVLMQAALLLLLVLPYVLLASDRPVRVRAREIGMRALWNGSALLLVSLSKLVAIWSFMRFFPRLVAFTQFSTAEPILLFLARTFWMIPQRNLAFDEVVYPAGLHEYSMFFSPFIVIGLIAMLAWFVIDVRRRKYRWSTGVILGLYTVFLLLVFAQLARGYGPLADAIHALPLFSSWRMNIRFLYLFTVLLSIGGVAAIPRLLTLLRVDRHSPIIAPVVSLLSILLLYPAYLSVLTPEFLDLTAPHHIIQKAIGEAGDYVSKPIAAVQDFRGKQISDLQYVLAGTTGLSCYETILSDLLPELTDGPTDTVTDGRFNLNHPACLQYPEANDCVPGDRILASDRTNFLRYISGRQPRWPLPLWQRLADAVTFLTLVVMAGVLLRQLWALRRSRPWKRGRGEG